ncbi:hypothetical protein BDF22DRAFT_774566 [Syncephalis plumigaleata]|nr:hypothetical protein BDF22DRAFT_774566 [Syncephalis plumigaleata]
MHFSINIISITAVAALLLASIESAVGMMGQPKMPKMYLGQPTGVKGAFGEQKLMLLKVPDEQSPVDYIEATWENKPATLICVDSSKLEGDTVQLFYNQHRLPLSEDMDNIRISTGAKYFGHVVATPSPFGKRCYVIDNACKYTYEQHIAKLSRKLLNKEMSFSELISDITSALAYAKFKGFLYIIHPNNMCFDANGNFRMRRHYGLLQTGRMASLYQTEIYTSLRELLFALIKLKLNNQIDLNTLNTQVNNIIQNMGYPMAPSSSPSGSRRGSISTNDPVPSYEGRRNSPPGSRRGSISGTSLLPPYVP